MHSERPFEAAGTIGINEFGYSLIPDHGATGAGECNLGQSGWLAPWLGRRVRIRGTRFDFHFLHSAQIDAIDGLPAPKPVGRWTRLKLWLRRRWVQENWIRSQRLP